MQTSSNGTTYMLQSLITWILGILPILQIGGTPKLGDNPFHNISDSIHNARTLVNAALIFVQHFTPQCAPMKTDKYDPHRLPSPLPCFFTPLPFIRPSACQPHAKHIQSGIVSKMGRGSWQMCRAGSQTACWSLEMSEWRGGQILFHIKKSHG